MAGPTFGFSTIGADRNVNVGTSELNGLVGITPVYDGGTIVFENGGNSNAEAVFELGNNLDQDFDEMNVRIDSVAGGDDGVLEIENRQVLFDGIATTDDPVEVIVGCSRDVVEEELAGTTVTFRIDAFASGVSITDALVTVQGVTYDCEEDSVERVEQKPGDTESNSITFDSSNAFVDGSRQGTDNVSVEFSFTSNYDSLVITALEIRSTSRDETIGLENPGQGQGGNAEVLVESNDQTGTITTGNNDIIRFGDGGIRLSDNVSVGAGSDATVTLQEFRNADKTNEALDMGGENVTVVLYFVEDANNDLTDDAFKFELINLQSKPE